MRSPTLLHEVIAWGRAHGWRHTREWLQSDRDADGAPWGGDTLHHKWSKDFGSGEVHEVDAYLADGDTLTFVAYSPDDSNDTGLFWGGRTIRQHGLALVVDGLAAAHVLPTEFSSAYKVGRGVGFEEGADSVTEISVTNLVDIELDKLEAPAAQAVLAERIRPLLSADEPYDVRVATKQIVESVWHVLERAS